MKHNKIELLVYGENLSSVSVQSEEPLKVIECEPNFSGKYLFVNLEIKRNATPGNYKLFFIKEKDTVKINFPIFEREFPAESHAGFSEEDIIYLIMPDRFANGDTTNDGAVGKLPNQLNRKSGLTRHGGDIKGIAEHLDYIAGLGATAIWITPLLENNMPISYHGYAATDLYKIDARFGSNDDYKNLIAEAHKRKIKIIYDHVSNHVGINHPWVENPPERDWFHGTPENHLNALHEKMSPFDVHADSLVIKRLREGWFVNEMPDLNQKNPHLKKYLIQNAIWWIEYAGIDGIREDTYAYVDQDFLSEFISVIKTEYPKFNIVGEVWTGEPEFLSQYMKGNKYGEKNAQLNIVTDFAVRDALATFLQSGKLYPLYNVICKDFLYAPENKQLVFIDNHDLVRPAFLANGNTEKIKTAFTAMFTLRGIPQILYGDEIGLYGGKEHGEIREDFPGGWKSDKRNAFEKSGRTEKENELFEFVKKLIEIRKNNPALAKGELVHFPPQNNVYFYIRKTEASKYLILLNGNDFSARLDLSIAKNEIKSDAVFYDEFTGEKITADKILLAPFSFKIFEIK